MPDVIFDRAAIIIMDWQAYPDDVLCVAVQVVRDEWQKLDSEPGLLSAVMEGLRSMKWNHDFIHTRPHDMTNPGVNADYALLDLAKRRFKVIDA